MSSVKIEVKDMKNGFVEISVDGKSCGAVEDPEDELVGVLKRMFNILDCNCEVVRKDEDD